MTTYRKRPNSAELLPEYLALRLGQRLPEPEDPFNVELIPGFSDGDWPAWPQQEMLGWIPEEIQFRYGIRQSSVFNGPFLRFPPEKESEIVGAFKTLGFHCVKNPLLVEDASR